MKALLDTSAFIWALSEPERLSQPARQIVRSEANDVYLSAVTVWEIAIKYAKAALQLDEHPSEFMPRALSEYRLRSLDVNFNHALATIGLPPIHRDPFDRMLIAQAQVEGLPIITSDARFSEYGVEVIW